MNEWTKNREKRKPDEASKFHCIKHLLINGYKILFNFTVKKPARYYFST
jgi:hypothetical protein